MRLASQHLQTAESPWPELRGKWTGWLDAHRRPPVHGNDEAARGEAQWPLEMDDNGGGGEKRLTQADAPLREAENLFKQPGPPLPLAPLGWSSVMVKGGGSGAEAGRDYPPYYPGGS